MDAGPCKSIDVCVQSEFNEVAPVLRIQRPASLFLAAPFHPPLDAARVVRESTSRDDALPESLEAAWEAWSAGIQGCDERTYTLLRAAFEAGIGAAKHREE